MRRIYLTLFSSLTRFFSHGLGAHGFGILGFGILGFGILGFGTLATAAPQNQKKPQPKAKVTVTATPSPSPTFTPVPPTPIPTFRGFESVCEEALRRKDGVVVEGELPALPREWREISYSEFQSIRFRSDQSLWRGSGDFEVQLFHPGFIYGDAVRVHVIENGESKTIPFDRGMFRYDTPRLGELPLSIPGFAGFRVHYPLHSTSYKDEFLVFLGATYFKLLGRTQQYGLSARGLTVDTALPSGEEFPRFSEFWLVKPEPQSSTVVTYALLESPRVVGAYEFRTTPGTVSTTDIRATLYLRAPVEKIGLAPLTSMFLYGESKTRFFDDFRPEVHDSDGMLMHRGNGEWVWRPLHNFKLLTISAFEDTNMKGFGLLQRDRRYDSYQDLESLYHRRPSYWVEPLGGWGEGHVELVEIPNDSEINDNVTVYWVPKKMPTPDAPFEFSYRVSAYGGENVLGGAGKVRSTRISSANRPGSPPARDPNGRLFIIEFEGGDLPWLQGDQPVEAIVTSSTGEIHNKTVQRNPETGGWRLFFDLYPNDASSVDLRAFLRFRGDVLTETWSYLWKQE